MKNYERMKIITKNNKRRIKRVIKEKDTNEKKNLIFLLLLMKYTLL